MNERFSSKEKTIFPFRVNGEGFVCDKDGEVVTFYHGTDKPITEFETKYVREFGFHFGAVNQANDRLDKLNSVHNEVGGVVIPVKIKTNKHVVLPDWGVWTSFRGLPLTEKEIATRKNVCEQLSIGGEEKSKIVLDNSLGMEEFLEKLGVDTVFYINNGEAAHEREWSLISLKPGNIFSAITGENIWKEGGKKQARIISLGKSILG